MTASGMLQARAASPLALITITVMLGTIMAIIDSTIVNVALDTIAGNLGATIDDAGWVATGCILSSVIVVPLNGWPGDGRMSHEKPPNRPDQLERYLLGSPAFITHVAHWKDFADVSPSCGRGR